MVPPAEIISGGGSVMGVGVGAVISVESGRGSVIYPVNSNAPIS